jgi:glycosyltransferase involved in cell wall biosynthesis
MRNIEGINSYSFLLICHSYPPVLGGSELEAQRVCEALIKKGHRALVVCAGGHPMPPLKDWVDPRGVPVRIYAGNWKGRLKDIVFAIRVAHLLVRQRNHYQFVYFLMQGLHLAIGLPITRALGKPILMKIAGSGVMPEMQRSITGRLELAMLRKWAHSVMILNDGMRQEALKCGFPSGQLLWMPNPVDTNEFAPCEEDARQELRGRYNIKAESLVVLSVGRLEPVKALPILLEAFSIVVSSVPEAFLVIVGDGSLRPELEEQARRLKLSEKQVRFTGQVSPGEVPSYLKLADVFALISHSEGLPCSLIEAMSVGMPSIVSQIPANSQLVENMVHGLLVPPGNAPRVATGLLRLLRDKELRSHMGEAARKNILENYSTEHVVFRYEELFQKATQSA